MHAYAQSEDDIFNSFINSPDMILLSFQLILTKICLMLGVHVYIPCHFLGISEPVLQEEGALVAGWRAKFGEENQSADSFVFDVIVGASGKNCIMDGEY